MAEDKLDIVRAVKAEEVSAASDPEILDEKDPRHSKHQYKQSVSIKEMLDSMLYGMMHTIHEELRIEVTNTDTAYSQRKRGRGCNIPDPDPTYTGADPRYARYDPVEDLRRLREELRVEANDLTEMKLNDMKYQAQSDGVISTVWCPGCKEWQTVMPEQIHIFCTVCSSRLKLEEV